MRSPKCRRSEAACPRRLWIARLQQRVNGKGFVQSANLLGWKFPRWEMIREAPFCLRRKKQRLTHCLGQAFNARRDSHGCANGGEFESLRRANATDHRWAGVDADADFDRFFALAGEGRIEISKRVQHIARRGDGRVRVR